MAAWHIKMVIAVYNIFMLVDIGHLRPYITRTASVRAYRFAATFQLRLGVQLLQIAVMSVLMWSLEKIHVCR